MKKGLKISLIVLGIIVIVALIVIFAGSSKCSACPNPEKYSECNDDAIKERTNYKCDESTEFECESYTEQEDCITEIRVKATGIEATLSPTLDEKVKGIIKIEVTTVPAGTQLVAIGLGSGDQQALGPGTNYTFASQSNDVWTLMIDTTDYDNGLYSIGIASSPDGDSPPNAYVQTQIVISN